MPDGAQAWKMIKTPGSRNDRISQACDRCRSKKIKCDGKRPHCTQCASVGFECKITDKLTRRAFPRGYTESLEDRIRQLETDNQKLTHLLDLKDEQLEMISKVEHVSTESEKASLPTKPTTAASTKSPTRPLTALTTAEENTSPASIPSLEPAGSSSSSSGGSSDEDDDNFAAPQVQVLNIDDTYNGSSSGAYLLPILQEKFSQKAPGAVFPMQQVFKEPSMNGVSYSSSNALLEYGSIPYHTPPPSITSPIGGGSGPTTNNNNNNNKGSQSSSPSGILSYYSFASLNVGSRLTCDQLVTTYFQEWHSMFTIVDQYAFLGEYQKYVNDAEGDDIFAVTLVLVLALASLTSKTASIEEFKQLECEWKRLFTPALQSKPGLRTNQALCLAQLYSLYTNNHEDLWQFRMMNVNMAQRIGLYKCQSNLKSSEGAPLSYYMQEMRRRTFWNVYTLDTFTAGVLGTVRMINDRDVTCKLPVNVDDDSLHNPESHEGMESTCALSVITFTQIFARILDSIYGSSSGSGRSGLNQKQIIIFEDQLEKWRKDLSSHLKFEFANGVPTASLSPVHQKSPLLLMMYHLGRVYLYAPTLVTNTPLPRGSGSSVAALNSAKTFIQVFNYLLKRNVVSTLCINPSKILIQLSTIVLYSAVDYSRGGALLQDARALLSNAREFIYSEMQADKPGCISGQCYQWFEEASDVVLGSLSHTVTGNLNMESVHGDQSVTNARPRSKSKSGRKQSIPGSKKKKQQPQQLEQQAQKQHQQVHDAFKRPESPPPEGDLNTSALDLLQNGLNSINSIVQSESQPDDVLQTIEVDTLLFRQGEYDGVVKNEAADDDYLDFWNPVDYMKLCDRTEGFYA